MLLSSRHFGRKDCFTSSNRLINEYQTNNLTPLDLIIYSQTLLFFSVAVQAHFRHRFHAIFAPGIGNANPIWQVS